METTGQNGRAEIRWSPRVRKDKIRRLYEQDARGIVDEELVDDVGYALYLRCQSILTVTEAMYKRRVLCPRCARQGRATTIERHRSREELLTCPVCGWQITWREYQKSFKHKQLHGGGAVDAFQTFMQKFDAARSARERLNAIDRVIHEFHYAAKNTLQDPFGERDPDEPTRPASVNLIEGDIAEVIAFLNELTYGSPDAKQTEETWRRKLDSTYWPDVLAQRQQAEAGADAQDGDD